MIFRVLSLVVAIAIVYPLAVAVQIGIDWFRGDGEFIRLFMYDSRRRLLLQLLNDWESSVLLCAAAFAAAALIYHSVRNTGFMKPFPAWLILSASPVLVALLDLSRMMVILYAISCLLFALWNGVLTLIYNRRREWA